MPLSLAYWILMLLWVATGVWWGTTLPAGGRYPVYGWSLLLFLLFIVIGLHDFGAPLRGG